ncbi:GNAT family N-acetyltransferase [Luteipulveratus mongoliensis]|uniref:N-acetyltransferase domain-containing protein n=1 Tax=Luteipulveratus mongoliensis TaxID=571913 RepID=A0A0K1JQ61_9MICO|nr:GNAT family N-acetyltransferase [Luteipulveratus mongoliensis]AKU18859.1 hypothetical protein VV02_12060 [Luteipulveratus mongoliensis]
MGAARFVIRRADLADEETLDRAGQIAGESYVDGGHIAADAAYVTHLTDATVRARDAELWVAQDPESEAVLGSVAFVAPGSRLAELAKEREGEFRMLTVDAAARGRGVGEALVRHCLARARELDLAALVLSTQPSMRSAHRIYERLGFTRTPARDWSPVAGVHLLTYRLEL